MCDENSKYGPSLVASTG